MSFDWLRGRGWLWGRARPTPPEWAPAPVSRSTPTRAEGPRIGSDALEEPTYEDFVLLRCRLPSDSERALEVARRAAVNDLEIRRRVLQAVLLELEAQRLRP